MEGSNVGDSLPGMQKMNILIREDFRGRDKVDFKCAECGHAITLDNPDSSVEVLA